MDPIHQIGRDNDGTGQYQPSKKNTHKFSRFNNKCQPAIGARKIRRKNPLKNISGNVTDRLRRLAPFGDGKRSLIAVLEFGRQEPFSNQMRLINIVCRRYR